MLLHLRIYFKISFEEFFWIKQKSRIFKLLTFETVSSVTNFSRMIDRQSVKNFSSFLLNKRRRIDCTNNESFGRSENNRKRNEEEKAKIGLVFAI